jgi:hypothetical protein
MQLHRVPSPMWWPPKPSAEICTSAWRPKGRMGRVEPAIHASKDVGKCSRSDIVLRMLCQSEEISASDAELLSLWNFVLKDEQGSGFHSVFSGVPDALVSPRILPD